MKESDLNKLAVKLTECVSEDSWGGITDVLNPCFEEYEFYVVWPKYEKEMIYRGKIAVRKKEENARGSDGA